MDMSVCQTGVPCVWGRRHADTVVCSLPRCVVFQLRTGYLDRLRGGWVKYGVFQKEVERLGVEVETGSTDPASDVNTTDELLPTPVMMSHSS